MREYHLVDTILEVEVSLCAEVSIVVLELIWSHLRLMHQSIESLGGGGGGGTWPGNTVLLLNTA